MKELHKMTPLEMAYEVDHLRAINAELLEALEVLNKCFVDAWNSRLLPASVVSGTVARQVEATIAKARGEDNAQNHTD